MSRPCECDRGACGLCRLYRESPRHRAAWDAPPPPAAPPEPPPPAARPRCGHLGDEPANGRTLVRLGLSLLRDWLPCAMGHGEAGHVCPCHEATVCGACPDYAAP